MMEMARRAGEIKESRQKSMLGFLSKRAGKITLASSLFNRCAHVKWNSHSSTLNYRYRSRLWAGLTRLHNCIGHNDNYNYWSDNQVARCAGRRPARKGAIAGSRAYGCWLQCSSCFTCSDILEKVFEQHLHEYFLTLACVWRWARRFDLSAKAR